MKILSNHILDYLDFCKYQKELNEKTIKAYRIDLLQFITYMDGTDGLLSKANLSNFITTLHQQYRPKSVKRKIASMKAFFNHLMYEEIITENPFAKMKVKFNTPFLLPRTIPLNVIAEILALPYQMKNQQTLSAYQYHVVLRDIAVLELLFATGMRVSELCSLTDMDVDLVEGNIKIFGKGSKERIVQIGNKDVIASLIEYKNAFNDRIEKVGFFFVNRLMHRLSEQSVRFMINKYVDLTGLHLHITPHMFRHSFATLLLEEDVDIRYIQQLLGHSSIVTTQIYTHVASKKQRDILSLKHPRNKISI